MVRHALALELAVAVTATGAANKRDRVTRGGAIVAPALRLPISILSSKSSTSSLPSSPSSSSPKRTTKERANAVGNGGGGAVNSRLGPPIGRCKEELIDDEEEGAVAAAE